MKIDKELEALESMKNRLTDAKFTIEGTTLYSKNKDLDDDYKLLCKALQRLADIDNSKPSEALECLESEKKIMWAYDYDIIKNALQKAQEMEKELKQKEYLEFMFKRLIASCKCRFDVNAECDFFRLDFIIENNKEIATYIKELIGDE